MPRPRSIPWGHVVASSDPRTSPAKDAALSNEFKFQNRLLRSTLQTTPPGPTKGTGPGRSSASVMPPSNSRSAAVRSLSGVWNHCDGCSWGMPKRHMTTNGLIETTQTTTLPVPTICRPVQFIPARIRERAVIKAKRLQPSSTDTPRPPPPSSDAVGSSMLVAYSKNKEG